MPDRPTRPNRRTLILGGGALVLGGATVAAWATRDRFEGDAMSPGDALAAARAGDILLIDIRRPDEWEATGIPEGAAPLDMRRDDFAAALSALAGAPDRPIALICARGVRSDRLSARLTEAGFTRIIDVPEGMLGSSAGPGWLARDLPVVRP
ncbi:rhodanese-like domain-containing protein [Jannaschia sp. KMU-145]|uniref:rhodanese-like domain-containing protein n=1 Tax=Jannaschia halovivens TaxID=3388667 RepID=UPI00396B1A24